MNATPVSKEEVRLLAIEVGVREAARRLGLNEDRVCKWSERGKWFSTPIQKKAKTAIVSTVSRPGDILLDTLHEHERETKLSLARYARKAAQDNEQAGLEQAPMLHKVGQLAGLVHKWGEQGKTGNQFTLNVLNINSLAIDQDQTE